MTILTPTKTSGSQVKVAPLLYGESDHVVNEESLAAQLSLDGVKSAFLADALSAFLTHERCGRHLYKSLAARTQNPVFRRKYVEFGEETERHVAILEELVVAAGGNPSYVSPLARAVEASDSKNLESTYLTDGTSDPATVEAAMLNAVFIAEVVDQANWRTLELIAAEIPEGELRAAFQTAVQQVLGQEDEHLEWASASRSGLTLLQLRSVVEEPLKNEGQTA